MLKYFVVVAVVLYIWWSMKDKKPVALSYAAGRKVAHDASRQYLINEPHENTPYKHMDDYPHSTFPVSQN